MRQKSGGVSMANVTKGKTSADIMPDTMPVSSLSGVSPGGAREAQLHKLGIYTVGDILRHYPRRYEFRGDVVTVKSVIDELSTPSLSYPFPSFFDNIDTSYDATTPKSFILTVVTEPKLMTSRRGLSYIKFRAADDTGVCEVVFFNQPYLKRTFPTGSRFRFYGKPTLTHGSLRLTSPSYEAAPPGAELAPVVPVYSLTSGMTQKKFSGLVKKAFSLASSTLLDRIPEKLREKRSLPTLRYAIENIHFPSDEKSLDTARRRLVYEEFLIYALKVMRIKATRDTLCAHYIDKTDITPLISQLPFPLTGAQKRAINDIYSDLRGKNGKRGPMYRIVVGDVGCGKTVVAAAAAYFAIKNGFDCAMMAPTEILARQHYADLSDLLGKVGIKVVLLVGSQKARERRESIDACCDPNGPPVLAVGTHALIEEDVRFRRLGLVITDEQHRFGVMQRAALSGKGESAHVLVMSATPIPRTLSLVMFGDLDESKIDEMPPGRQRVTTYVVDESYLERIEAFMKSETESGHQVYVVCPAVDDDNDGNTDADPDEIYDDSGMSGTGRRDMMTAVGYAEALSKKFPDIKVAYVHGKMKGAEKDAVMRSFAANEIKILVSTTVIEVGVNVPNATLMVVLNAERFGLSQLHQLRGRVGRGSAKSICILVSRYAKAKGTTAYERLETMRTTYDGFAIAERDLALRGPGDYLPSSESTRQSGEMPINLAGMDSECAMKILEAAFQDAREIISDDPTLSKHEHEPLAAITAPIEGAERTIS